MPWYVWADATAAVLSPVWLLVVMASACASSALASYQIFGSLAHRRARRRVRQALNGTSSHSARNIEHLPLVIVFAQRASAQQSFATVKEARPQARASTDKLSQRLARAGLSGRVSPEGFARGRLHYALLLGLLTALLSLIVAPHMALLAALCVAGFAWLRAPHSLQALAKQRAWQLEAHLSEAIEVICLGLRGGMSFDRALNLYCTWFSTLLSRELASAAGSWHAGMLTREQALRSLAESYDSDVFARVVDSIVRSMRYGSPLADALEVLADEARASHRAQVQEKVMKAPVKMMVPIGVLILPSMLLLVMGPILLELAGGL